MRFFCLLIALPSVIFGVPESAAPVQRWDSFENINKHVILSLTQPKTGTQDEGIGFQADFDPSKTVIFIDLDDTLLSHDGRQDGTQKLRDPDAIMFMKRWKDAGFKIAFLTSRKANERQITLKNLEKLGVTETLLNTSLFITNGEKKGKWLEDNQAVYLQGFNTIIHIDDKKQQLQSVAAKVCGGKTCHLIHFGQQADIVYGDERIPNTIEGFNQESTQAGGTKSTFILKDGTEPKFVIKKGEGRIPQFKEEVLADAIYKAIGEAESSFGIQVPPFKLFIQDGSYNRVTTFLPGAELGFNRKTDVAKGFIVDAFMANWDLVVRGKNLWLSNDNIYRMDNGGSLRYGALGGLKSTTGYDFSDAKCDIDTMRGINCGNLTTSQDGKQFYDVLTEAEILHQIERLIPLKEKILETADHYNSMLRIDNYAELRSNLITRLDSLREYYYDHPKVLARYERAHPRRMVAPDRSSASVLVYSNVNGTPKILLGQRERHNWWGNLGGKADAGDETLLNTAVRETQEESMGLFHFSKEGADGLVESPSHDLIKGGNKPDALHRMYLAQHDFVPEDQFNESLKKQTVSHNKEYTDFTWVDVKALLALVESNLKTENNPKNEKQYVLNIGNKEIYIHHPLMDMLRQQPVRDWFKALDAKEAVRKIHTQGSLGVSMPTVQTRKITSYKIIRGDEETQSKPIATELIAKDYHDTSYPEPPFWDPRSERLVKLTHLTTKHINVLTEIKQAPKKQHIDEIKRRDRHAAQVGYSTENANKILVSNPTLPARTATDAYLSFALGNAYKPGQDQKNVFLFLKDHSTLSKFYADEFSETSPTCGAEASYKCTLLKVMEKEREMQNWFVFYHTLPGKLGFIYDIATEFRNILRLKGSDSMHSLRSLEKFFKGLADVDAFIEDELKRQNKTDFTAMNNYEGTFQEKGLSVNMTLFGNKEVDTSSSFHMFHANKTISPPNYERFLAALLSEFGILDTQKYFDLFDRYFGKVQKGDDAVVDGKILNTETGDNHLLQIFIHPNVADSMVYLAGSLGKGLYQTLAEQKQKLLPSAFLKQMRENPVAAHDSLKMSDVSDNEKGGGLHRLQARIFMKPELMTDDSKVKIIRYTKSEVQKKYMAELKEMVREDLKAWITARYELQKNTLENPEQEGMDQALPPLQKVVRHMDQAEGKLYKTKTPEELYGKFLLDDNLEGIKQILARNPDFDLLKEIKNPDYKSTIENISPALLIGNSPGLIKYFINKNFSERIKEQVSAFVHKENPADIDAAHIKLIQALWEKGVKIDVDSLTDLVDKVIAGNFAKPITSLNTFLLYLLDKGENVQDHALRGMEYLTDSDTKLQQSAQALFEKLKTMNSHTLLPRIKNFIQTANAQDIKAVHIELIQALWEKGGKIDDPFLNTLVDKVIAGNFAKPITSLNTFLLNLLENENEDVYAFAYYYALRGMGYLTDSDTKVQPSAQALFEKLKTMDSHTLLPRIKNFIENANPGNITAEHIELIQTLWKNGGKIDDPFLNTLVDKVIAG
ncbi:MAG: hypothetical protein COY39_05290, partial [Alphaproteobacteria bacterium CG_4_10_14_0_8_um_filter_37_21]